MIDWKRKLTSRKFWMAVIGFVTGLLTYLGIGGEGLADAAAANTVILSEFEVDDGDNDGNETD